LTHSLKPPGFNSCTCCPLLPSSPSSSAAAASQEGIAKSRGRRREVKNWFQP
jgi:hypothetical protein